MVDAFFARSCFETINFPKTYKSTPKIKISSLKER